MPRGAPDYSNVRAYGPLHRLDDLAELAARLGSPVTHDRKGRVVFMDGFEHGMAAWQTLPGATGGSIALSTDTWRSGGFSVKMVGGSGAGESSQLYRRFAYPALSEYGFEFSVLLDDTIQKLDWRLLLRDGEDQYSYKCIYTPADKEVVVVVSDGSEVAVIEDIELATGYGLFHTIKLVADFENNEYSRLVVNEESVGLSAYGPVVTDYPYTAHVSVAITLYSNTGDNDVAYIDDIILTQSE